MYTDTIVNLNFP